MKYIYQNSDWHCFRWCGEKVLKLLSEVKLAQGLLIGKMNSLQTTVFVIILVDLLYELVNNIL